MEKRPFSIIARDCARVLREVLEARIATPQALMSSWPADAENFVCLDEARDDVFEYWLLEPGVEYRSVIQACINVLDTASDDPEATHRRMEKAIDES